MFFSDFSSLFCLFEDFFALKMIPINILIARVRRRQRIRELNLQRVQFRDTFNPFGLDDVEFRRRFRLTKPKAQVLIDSLLPHMRNIPRRGALSPRTRIFAALQFFATGSYQRLVGQSVDISISQQSVSNCVREVASLLTHHLAQIIQFPTTIEQKQLLKNEFFRKYHFPGVIGAIDCTHVRILAPREEEHNYLNRKGYHSLNVQIVSKKRIPRTKTT